ncbi:MAG: response regulator transcription factor [Chloroflexota bacterium]
MSQSVIRVAIVDDHPLIVDGLTHFLNCEQDVRVVASCYNGDDVLNMLRRYTIDLLLLDLQMPYDGFHVLADMQRFKMETPVLVFTGMDDQKTLECVMEYGAAGLICKTQSFITVRNAIRQIAAGLSVFPRRMTHAKPTNPLSDTPKNLTDTILSEREIEVLALVSQGLTNSEIASQLTISKNTVGYHLKNIYSKLEISNRTEAAAWYFSHMSSFD